MFVIVLILFVIILSIGFSFIGVMLKGYVLFVGVSVIVGLFMFGIGM